VTPCFALTTRAAALLTVAVLVAACEGAELRLYVATNGNDAWSGTLAAPKPAGTDGPFATLTRARDALRQLRAAGKLDRPVTVLVRGGTYHLPETLVLGPEDSGTATTPVAYEAHPGEKVVLSGGRRLKGWRPRKGEIQQCDLEALGLHDAPLRQLFYNGTRQPLARVPNVDPEHPRTGGWMYVPRTFPIPDYNPAKHDRTWVKPYDPALKTHLAYDPSLLDPSKWADPTAAEVSLFPWQCWNNNIVRIQAVDTASHVLTLAGKGASYKIIRGNRFFVRNVPEELDAPGEWCVDPKSRTLCFWPPDDGLGRAEVVVPALASIVQLRGDAAKKAWVEHVRIAGFAFRASQGPAVVLSAAQHCTVARSTFANVGREAVYIGSGCSHNRVVGNDITDTGTSGVKIRNGDRNLVSNNHIHHFSVVYRNSPGVSVRGKANVIAHNLIHDGPRSGVVFSGADNVMELNRVHHMNLEASDSCMIGMYCGGSYEKARARLGNVMRYNFVSDSGGYSMKSPGRWRAPWHTYGLRMDDLTSGVTVYGNIIVRTVSGAVQIHSGKDNVIENNILVDGSGTQVCFSNTLAEFKKIKSDMSGNRFVRNIVAYTRPEASLFVISNWTRRMIAEADHNVYFHAGHPLANRVWPRAPEVATYGKWRELGYDAHSLVADPLFVDPANGDYRLRPGSPALKLGFKPIPIDRIGLQPSPDRASWPVDNQLDIPREQPLLETGPAPAR